VSDKWRSTLIALCIILIMDIFGHVNSMIDRKRLHRDDEAIQQALNARANIPDSVYQARTEIMKLMIARARDNRPFTKQETDRIDALWSPAQFDGVK
jgi:hypothetical protein